MSIASKGLSALGRLAAIMLLAVTFLFGLAGVVYMSLQGEEVKVPEITGRDFAESEKELALLGLKIKKRADRASAEKPNTVIEQLPKPGETVKTGQMILVVTSKGGGEADEKPPTLKNDEDDTERIEEMISDKPKKAKTNSNTNRKKADTARDVNAAGNTASGTNSNSSNSNKKEPGSNSNSSEKGNKNTQVTTPTRPGGPATPKAGSDAKPKPAKP